MMPEIVDPSEILLQPYAWVLTPQNPGYHATVKEFPGTNAYGETAEEAFRNLEEVVRCWIAGMTAKGLEIPPPLANYSYEEDQPIS